MTGRSFATVVTLVISPLLLPAAVTLVLLLDIGSDMIEIVATVSLIVVAFLVIPLADIDWMIRRGKTLSVEIPNREARTEPFAVAIVTGSAAVLVLRAMDMPGESLIHVMLVTYLVNMILVMGINVVWKISVHMVALGGSLAILIIASGLSGESSPVLTNSTVVPLLGLVPLVGWARYRLNAHTVAQIVVGAVIGFCCHWLALLTQVGR